MCGRFTLHATDEQLASILGSAGLAGFTIKARYNIAPSEWILVVRPAKSGRAPALAQWGLVPHWAKDPKAGPRPINARAEGIGEKPSFRGPFRHGRCIVPISGYYEWQVDGRDKIPYYICPSGGLALLAGLVDTWPSPTGEELTTCAIVTTEAHPSLASLHHRMPVFLQPAEVAFWLDPNTSPKSLQELLKPSGGLEAFQVSREVNNVKNDHPGLIEPVQPSRRLL